VKEILERQTRQMARLVDDLLDLSRIARGQLQLHRERVDLAAAVRQAAQTSAPLIEARRHYLSVTVTDQPLWLEADPSRLVQVLVNLLNNAAKYTDSGGRIELTAGQENGEAMVRVRDTGIGITAEMLPRVFDQFVQVEQARHRSEGGLGIGLALVRRLVELQGGTVAAHSDGPGRGSEFVVRLPLPAEPPAPAAPPGEKAEVAAGSRRILIIEDHADSRETLATLLTLLGHQSEVAGDGPAGVERALAGRPDVALIDLGLPGLDGYEVARRIRDALDRQVFLVALTGFGQAEDRQRALEAGFDAHMLKPVDIKDLTDLLQSLPLREESAPGRPGG
jgi:CheY-like chemotaxis protein